jgi:hypothetical protein
MPKGEDSPKMKLFNTVACLVSNLMEFDHALDQSGQAAIHRRFIPLILDDWGNRSLFPHVARVCMSTRTHLCWDPVQQLLKEA